MGEPKLTPQRVHDTAMACLFRDGEDQTGAVIVEGVASRYGFHPGRAAEQKSVIAEMLAQLPHQFREGSGPGGTGGWSFLNGCTTDSGELWTGDQMAVEMLFALGMAAGLATCLVPRDLWPALPGGVPYYSVKVGDDA